MASPPRRNGGRHQLGRANTAPPLAPSSSIPGSSSGVSRQGMHQPTLQSDTVVFQHAKLPSRQAASAGAAPMPDASQAPRTAAPRGGPNSSAPYSNTWSPSSSAAAHAAAVSAQAYHHQRSEQDERMHAHSGSRGYVAMHEREDANLRHHRHAYSSNVRAAPDTAMHQHGHRYLDAERSSNYAVRRSEASECEPGGSVSPYSHRMQDGVTSTPPRLPHLQQQQQRDSGRIAHNNSSQPPRANSTNIVRMTIRVMKEGNKLGFGIRHDAQQKLRVTTLQGNSAAAKSPLQLGDVLLSVNGVSLTDLSFLEVIQHLKATRPGELVFDVERDVNASPNHAYDYPPTDFDINDDYGGEPSSSFLQPLPPSRSALSSASGPLSRQPSPQQPLALGKLQPPASSHVSDAAASSGARAAVYPSSRPVESTAAMSGGGVVGGGGAGAGIPAAMAPPVENQRKRARPAGSVDAAELTRIVKTHKQVVNTLVLELKKERGEKVALDDKNNALRKRLQKMLIECDEVRVRASTEVATVKDTAKRQTQQLEKALTAAKAQLRLQDRGPSVARTDSIVNDLVACKAQLERVKRIDADRSAQLSARFAMENRHADREAHRVREKLVALFRAQLRHVAKRNANPAPPSSSSAAAAASGSSSAAAVKADSAQVVTVVYEGIRRLAFLKLFGFPHDLEQYASPEFYSLAQVHRNLEHDEFADLFGSTLAHEERTGIFVVAVAPMDVAYDPSTERLSLVCGWAEQNTIRELARNFRF